MKKKILVIDDCHIVLETMRSFLEDLKYEVTILDNAIDACKNLESTRYDLIFTDLHMPKMNGIEFTVQAKKLPNCKFIPIVMVSADNEQEKKLEAKSVGIATFLNKPIEERQLQNILKIVLGS